MDEDEELDEFNEEEEFKKIANRNEFNKSRISVSAEVYGEFNQKRQFKPPVYHKTEEQKQRVLSKLNTSILFNGLDDKEKQVIVLAMKVIDVAAGSTIIKQGDEGNELFVVDTGSLDCFKRFADQHEDKFLVSYGPGGAFGELALLYNAPRAATIIAKEKCVLFSLDRESFNNIVKEAVIKNRQFFSEFLSKVQLLDSLTAQEKDKICDCLKTSLYKPGDMIIKQGDKGDDFYFILEGNCHAVIRDPSTFTDKIVYQYSQNDYFGELAMLRDEPRAASIIADSELKLASIDRASFKRLLGPLENILKKNTEKYKKFVS